MICIFVVHLLVCTYLEVYLLIRENDLQSSFSFISHEAGPSVC